MQKGAAPQQPGSEPTWWAALPMATALPMVTPAVMFVCCGRYFQTTKRVLLLFEGTVDERICQQSGRV